MELAQQLTEHVRACFSGLWIASHEHSDAIEEIAGLCRQEAWRLRVWDVERGMQGFEAAADPLAALRSLDEAEGGGESPQPTLLVLVNFHRFLGSAEVVQAMARQIDQGRRSRSFVVVLAPVVQVPVELERQMVVLQHRLPSRDQLLEIARQVATEPGELPDGDDLQRVLDAASGLSRYEAEGAFALSLVREGRLAPATLWELKAQALASSGLVTLRRGAASFDSLGGLAALKAFCRRALRPRPDTQPNLRPEGVLLLGVPGTGKSAIAQAVGAECGRPTLVLDVGRLMGSLVGQTEERTRQALATIDAMAPCVLFVDELEKAIGASNTGDSGVGTRMLGSLLTWLADHTSDVFVIATANDISRLPPELTRAERFDAIYFLDLPGREQKDAIWTIHREAYAINASQRAPDDADWTGAEIRACCRLSRLLDLPLTEAARHVVPIASTAAESVNNLRSWASGRCLSAETPGVYRQAPNAKRRRTLRSDPSNN